MTLIDNFVVVFCGVKDLNGRAQAEVTIREALRELDLWGAAATFNLTEYTDSSKRALTLIKDWKDVVNQVNAQQKHKHGLCHYQNVIEFILLTLKLLGLQFREQM